MKIAHGERGSVASSLFCLCGSWLMNATTMASPILELSNERFKANAPITPVQGVNPSYLHRGVHLDGSLRSAPAFPWAIAGNPFASAIGGEYLGFVSLFTGAFAPNDFDISLPAPGASAWTVGRTHNPVQWTAVTPEGGPPVIKGYRSSNGYQGKNWFQSSQPEIQFVDGATDDKDFIYVVYGADRMLEFQRAGTEGTAFNTFKGKNGVAGAVLYTNTVASGEPDTYTYYDQRGNRVVYFGFDGDAGAAAGQIWKTIDTAGNTAFVGDVSTGSTAISSGFDGSGRILKAYDGADRRFTYTYTTLDSVVRLTQVKAETKASGTWASPSGVVEVAKVDYDYYQTGGTTYGDAGNLKLVTVTSPLSPSGVSSVAKKYYRYWTGTYNSSTNPGHPDTVQYVVDFEGTRAFDYSDSTFNDSFLTASESSLKPYASAYFTYNSDHKVASAWFNGQCGCGGAGNGTHAITYSGGDATFPPTGTYSSGYFSKAKVDPPAGGALQVSAFDSVGQPLSSFQSIDFGSPFGDFTKTWGRAVARNSDGQVEKVHSRTNITAYNNSTDVFTPDASVGLVSPKTQVPSSDLKGFDKHQKYQVAGTGGTSYLRSTTEYTSASLTVGSVGVVRPFVSESWRYTQETATEASGGSGPTGAYKTAYSYAFHTGDAALVPKQIDTTHPVVSTGTNGPNSAAAASATYRTDGKTEFTKTTDGVIGYTAYNSLGQVVAQFRDVDTSHADLTGVTIPSGFSSTGTEFHLKTTYTYDPQGRLDTTTHPDGRVTKNYYTRLADHRLVTISIPRQVAGGSATFYGPVSYSVVNFAGKTEAQGTIAVAMAGTTTALSSWVNTATADPIAAVSGSAGSLKKYSTSIYDESGSMLEESRMYFLVPGSGVGTEGTNYDSTRFYYDAAGRRTKTKDPTGTIDRTRFDELGREKDRWTGTNDNDAGTFDDNREVSGTSDMVKVEALVYDGGNAGNNNLTRRTLFVVDSTTDQRITNYTYDTRNRQVLTENPHAPHALVKYDAAGRVVASAMYSSVSGLSGSSNPTSVATNRMALSEKAYDERGRVWQTTRHQIDPADGSSDDTLVSESWYDSEGRVIKAVGEQRTKTAYDRLGRAVRQYTLATDNDSAYIDAYDVAGDIVMDESQTAYDPVTGDALMRTTVARNWDDRGGSETTGALDTNADTDDLKVTAANLKGRVQITAMWYDELHRLTDTVLYGTYNGADFDRDGLSVPARSDTALRTSTSYNIMGLAEDITDPKALVSRTVYDDAGRRITSIANYVNGTPSGPTGDDDLHTRYVFTAGLQTKMWADLDGDSTEDADDQVTTYIFGVTKGTGAGDSKIGSSRLLQKVTYPDSTSGTDAVTFAYNAQGQQFWTKDQAGNITETTFDTAGRQISRAVTTLAGGFDGAVRRIETAYDSLGRTTTVTQFDAASSGSVVNEVKNEYANAGWGALTAQYQDHNSAVAGSGGDEYSVRWGYAETGAGTGRKTVRRTGQTLYNAASLVQTVGYTYGSGSGRHDDQLSLVTSVEVGSSPVTAASYEYLGSGRVAMTTLDQPQVCSGLYIPGASAGVYANIDRFDRVTSSKWTKDLATDKDFYSVTQSYDRNSNITVWDDAVLPGFDSSYTMDGLNRLTVDDQGTWSGSAITSGTRKERWDSGGLDQQGNWKRHKLDLNYDGAFGGSGEFDDSRTFNVANELTARDTDTNGVSNYSLTYDAVGNMTDDGKDYKYEYDAFGRLRKIKTTSGSNLVEEFTYDGLNRRIGWHYDTDADGTVEIPANGDPWYRFVYDEQWRMVATFREADADPKEMFVNHQPGMNGIGSALPIDATILRDRAKAAWADEAVGVYDRAYYCQNFIGGRGDVIAVLSSDGKQVQSMRYSAYGTPIGLPGGDVNCDGVVNTTDLTTVTGWIGGSVYDVRGDLDLDGDLDSADTGELTGNFGVALGRGVLAANPDSALTGSKGGFRKGYCGYEHDGVNSRLAHVRHRLYLSELGRWSRRDPLGYVDGWNQYGYSAGSPTLSVDASGLASFQRGNLGSVEMRGDDGWLEIGWPRHCSANPYHSSCVSSIDDPYAGNEGGGGDGGGCPPNAVCQQAGQPCKRLVVAFEGNTTFGFGGPILRDDVLRSICPNSVNGTTWTGNDTICRYFPESYGVAAVSTTINSIRQSCGQDEYPGLVVMGFSNGGDAALRYTRELSRIGVMADVGLTIDPIHHLWSGPLPPVSGAFDWHSWYQTCDETELPFPISPNIPWLRGELVSGATNNLVPPSSFDQPSRAHVDISRVVQPLILDKTMQVSPGRTRFGPATP